MTPPSCHSSTRLDLDVTGGDKIVMSKLWGKPGRNQAGEKICGPSRPVFVWKKKLCLVSQCEI